MCELALLLEVCRKNDYYNKNHIGQFGSGGRRAPTDESCPALFWVGVTWQAGSSSDQHRRQLLPSDWSIWRRPTVSKECVDRNVVHYTRLRYSLQNNWSGWLASSRETNIDRYRSTTHRLIDPRCLPASVRQPRSITSTTTYWDQCIFRITTCPPYSIIFPCSNNQPTTSSAEEQNWSFASRPSVSTFDLTRDLCNTFSATSVVCTWASESNCPLQLISYLCRRKFCKAAWLTKPKGFPRRVTTD